MRRLRNQSGSNRNNEKGAAMVMALLVSFLLMVASAGLLLEVTANTQNVTDLTTEQQAYDAAESGIQAAVNVLRDNVTLPDNKLLDAAPVNCTDPPEICTANRINYLKALDIDSSNDTTTGLDTVPRLSRWINYSSTLPDRVQMQNGSPHAFSLEVSDPDHTGAQVTYYTTGKLYDYDLNILNPNDKTQKTYGSGADKIVIKYIPQPAIQVDTTGGAANADFGSIRVTITGNGALIPTYNRFEFTTKMTQPYSGVRVLRGYIEPNTPSTKTATPRIRFDSLTYTVQGSVVTLASAGGSINTTYIATEPHGFSAQLNNAPLGTPTDSVISGTISSPEPIRLLLSSTGYGPRGSTKRLEAIIQKNFLNGLAAPATLTLIGPSSTAACPTCVPARPATSFMFNPGSSNVVDYSGQDTVPGSTDIIPPIGVSNDTNLLNVADSVDGLPPHPFNGNVIGVPSNITDDTPEWLSTPQDLDREIKAFYATSNPLGRYYPSGTTPPDFGSFATGRGITFCDGDVEFTGDGGGILIVTGKLTLRGAFNFRGLIIVTGRGGVDRRGAGNGNIFGNMVIAPYENNKIIDVIGPPAQGLEPPSGVGFYAAQYDLSGGGNSTIAYNSNAINSGLLAVSNFVLGVVEK